MKAPHQRLGHLGEEAAATHLRKKGYKILERNYVCGHKEVDIIAEQNGTLVFVEVKTRTYTSGNLHKYGRACLSVDGEKRRNLFAVALFYQNKYHRGKRIRFDVIEVYYNANDPESPFSLHHMPDAFRA